jgi:cytoskeleton protein RodZ
MAANDGDEIGRENSDSVQNLGKTLKSARESRDLTIDQIAGELRIAAPYLTALENGEYAALGPPVFARGYLKQYGARLGLHIPDLIALYDQEVGDQTIEFAPTRTVTLRDDRQITVWVVAAVVLLLIAALFWAWWWLGTDRSGILSAITDEPDIAAAAEQTTPPLPAPRLTTESATAPQVTTESALAPRLTTESALAPQAVTTGSIPPAQTALEAETDVVPSAEPGSGPELELVFVGDSWTEITDESGERLFYDLGRAGTSSRLPADRDLNLFFGNVAGVELSIDGEPYPIPAAARRRGDTAQFEFAARVDEIDAADEAD